METSRQAKSTSARASDTDWIGRFYRAKGRAKPESKPNLNGYQGFSGPKWMVTEDKTDTDSVETQDIKDYIRELGVTPDNKSPSVNSDPEADDDLSSKKPMKSLAPSVSNEITAMVRKSGISGNAYRNDDAQSTVSFGSSHEPLLVRKSPDYTRPKPVVNDGLMEYAVCLQDEPVVEGDTTNKEFALNSESSLPDGVAFGVLDLNRDVPKSNPYESYKVFGNRSAPVDANFGKGEDGYMGYAQCLRKETLTSDSNTDSAAREINTQSCEHSLDINQSSSLQSLKDSDENQYGNDWVEKEDLKNKSPTSPSTGKIKPKQNGYQGLSAHKWLEATECHSDTSESDPSDVQEYIRELGIIPDKAVPESPELDESDEEDTHKPIKFLAKDVEEEITVILRKSGISAEAYSNEVTKTEDSSEMEMYDLGDTGDYPRVRNCSDENDMTNSLSKTEDEDFRLQTYCNFQNINAVDKLKPSYSDIAKSNTSESDTRQPLIEYNPGPPLASDEESGLMGFARCLHESPTVFNKNRLIRTRSPFNELINPKDLYKMDPQDSIDSTHNIDQAGATNATYDISSDSNSSFNPYVSSVTGNSSQHDSRGGKHNRKKFNPKPRIPNLKHIKDAKKMHDILNDEAAFDFAPPVVKSNASKSLESSIGGNTSLHDEHFLTPMEVYNKHMKKLASEKKDTCT